MHTRTYTRYFNLEDIEPILKEADKLRTEWESRRNHVDIYQALEGDALIGNLGVAINQLTRRAD